MQAHVNDCYYNTSLLFTVPCSSQHKTVNAVNNRFLLITKHAKISMLLVFTESTRQRAYSLVAQAYTSITAEDFAAFVGYSVEEAVKGMNVSTGCNKDHVPRKPLYCCRGTHVLCFFCFFSKVLWARAGKQTPLPGWLCPRNPVGGAIVLWKVLNSGLHLCSSHSLKWMNKNVEVGDLGANLFQKR